ncbi:MAG: hypothetical protein HPY69_21025 [Armatimonadetes bacterium]|nr:hypothetical protein [Armatimonadota bacterium]
MSVGAALTTVAAVSLLPLALAASAQEPTWYPPTEPSSFIPDAARWVGTGSAPRTSYFRGSWTIAAPVRRAVLAVAPRQTVRVYLQGRLLAEAHSSHQATPTFAEVTGLLQPGPVHVAAKVYSEWGPELYVQMRVEYADGVVADFVTDGSWAWCPEPAADWADNPAAGGDWQPVKVGGGYHAGPGEVWGREFALLPRERLRARFAGHNERLRAEWAQERGALGFRPAGAPERPEWAAQFRDFARVDESTGQLVDGVGQVRHLFFTIYTQPSGLSLYTMDLDRLEKDLDLMVAGDVHFYVRMLGWGDLLTAEGDWAPLKQQPGHAGNLHFERAVDLLDHFVERAWAHGRYIVFEGDFFWSAHPLVPAPYRSRYHLYPEVLEAQALATRKIMNRYRDCPNVLGMMIGEEDIVLEHDLRNPHQQALFADFLQRKYGTLERFRTETPWGYDYDDRSRYAARKWRAERWEGSPEVDALVPEFAARRDPFAALTDFTQVPLPLWPWLLDPADPSVELQGCMSHNQFTPEDPLWIDFYEMREDELLFGMLCRWAEIVRPAMPRQLLFYSNAQDLTASWHFLHLYRRAELPFDVIGVGCHDSGYNLSELAPPWTVRKAIKIAPAYRPYVLAEGSPARGVASGEGEGGRSGEPQEILNYYRGALFDEIGGGAAWTQTYTWGHISGAEGGQESHLTPLLQWMGDFMPRVQGVAFPLRRPVHVLVVRNTNLAHSNMSGLDYGNTQAVAEFLTQLNVEFDIVMDRDLVYSAAGDTPAYKVALNPYRLVILPSVAIDICESGWEALNQWLSDPAAEPRVIALGWIGKRGARLQPREDFHPMLRKWLELDDYSGTVALTGPQEVLLETADGGQRLSVNFGQVPPCGTFATGEPVLKAGEAVIGARMRQGPGLVYAFGFPLGFAHEPLWGLEPRQEPRDAVVPLFQELLHAAAVPEPVQAPHNLRVYPSGDGRVILVRERAGLPFAGRIGVQLPPGVTYAGAEPPAAGDAYTRIPVSLGPWEGVCLTAQ